MSGNSQRNAAGLIMGCALNWGDTCFGYLPIGAQFQFKGDPAIKTKIGDAAYRDEAGRKFKTGKRVAVFDKSGD